MHLSNNHRSSNLKQKFYYFQIVICKAIRQKNKLTFYMTYSMPGARIKLDVNFSKIYIGSKNT